MPTPLNADRVQYHVRVDPGNPNESTPLGVRLDVPLASNTAVKEGNIRLEVWGFDDAAMTDLHGLVEAMCEGARRHVATVAARYQFTVEATRIYSAATHPAGDPWPAEQAETLPADAEN